MPSSPITDTIAQPDRTGRLLELLATVPDPRDPRGVRYALAGMLAVAVSAVLTGARSFTAIGEWAVDLSSQQLSRLGLGAAPEESTLRKLFTRLDADALDRVLGAWAWTRTQVVDGRRVIAIDGKTVRGARTRPTGRRRTWSPRSTSRPGSCSDNSRSPRRATRSLACVTCSPVST